MEPHHLLAIGLGNVHGRINNLKLEVESNISESFKVLNDSLTTLSSYIGSEFSSYDITIGDFDSLNFKTKLGGTLDIISALNYLESNKLHIELATELKTQTDSILTFIDSDSLGVDPTTHEVYTKDYIDNSIKNLYKDLNRCCVNVMGCECYNNSVSIIYNDNEYYYIDTSCSNVLTCYYLDSDNKEIEITSYGVIYNSFNQSNQTINAEDSSCIHQWYPVDKSYTSLTYPAKIITHGINVKQN